MIKRFFITYRYFFKESKKHHKKYLKNILIENKGKSLSIDDEENWIRKLNKLTYSLKNSINKGEAFAKSEIRVLKECVISKKHIIAICVEKNDIIKLKKFIEHHRNIGIDRFIILDNNSDDGTVEWLKEQEDIVLLQTKIPYTSSRRVGWINRIIAHYGYDRWYLVLDSDELLVYNDCENKKIQDVIDYCKKNNLIRVRAMMLDMYAKPEFYLNDKEENYSEENIYFDLKKYRVEKKDYINLVTGGFRNRVFGITPWLTKYPLFYFRKNDIYSNSHFLYPYKDNIKSDCFLVLKHYKFLPNEFEKYKKIAEGGNFFDGSSQYKRYITILEKKDLNFMCDYTTKYENSSSLDKLSVYKKISWE